MEHVLTTIGNRLQLSEVDEAKLNNGVLQHVVILYKQTGGNRLYVYDENLGVTQDSHFLLYAKKIILTNQLKNFDGDLVGVRLLDAMVTITGRLLISNWFKLTVGGQTRTIRDEYDLLTFRHHFPLLITDTSGAKLSFTEN